jgi:hypothetical protein
MKNILKKGLIILTVYLIFTLYLFAVSARIERLNNNESNEKVGVSINIGD